MPQKDDVPRIRDHDVPAVGGPEIPPIRDHDVSLQPSGGQTTQRSRGERQPTRSRAPLIALVMVAILGAIAIGVAVLAGKSGERQTAAPNPAVVAAHAKQWTLYDLARPQFLEYHVWIWVSRDGDLTWTDRVDAVIKEVAGVSREIPDLDVMIRLPRQFELGHVISPGDTIQCSEPTYLAWRHGVPGIISALVKGGVSERAIRSPVFADCGKGTPSPAAASDDRLYRIEIWLKSPALN